MAWVALLIKACGLLIVVLENVLGFSFEYNGMESAVAKYLRVLREQLPEFSWETCICKAVDYMLPQTRVRVFIRGIRRCISDKVPTPATIRICESEAGTHPRGASNTQSFNYRIAATYLGQAGTETLQNGP